jgi:putative flippase GtrA
MCDIVQAFIDYGIYLLYVFEWERATVCWTLSYTISIIIRHFSHRLLVFGEFEGTYCSSLTRTYMTYSSSIVISMLTNHLIVSFLNYSHRTAWIITMLWTGIYNYFMLKASWGRKTPANGGVDAINNTIKAKEQSKTALEVDYRRVPTSV